MTSPFAFLDRPTDAPVLVDAAARRVWTQDELADVVNSSAEDLVTGKRELVFCLCGGDVASIVGYLSAVRAGHAVALLDAAAGTDLTEALIHRYLPAFVVHSNDGQTPGIRQGSDATGPGLADELAVLLSTSGTTGSPKLVRLAHRNIEANANSIAEYLEIDATRARHPKSADPLLIRPLSAPQPPGCRGQRDSHAALHHAAGVLGRRCALAGHLIRRCAVLVCHPRTHGPSAQSNAGHDAHPDPGRGPPCAGVHRSNCTS